MSSGENPVRGWLHLPFPRHNRTAFVKFDLGRCVACGECAVACPREVLGIIGFPSHRHAHVDRAAECIGCRKCIASCSRGVIQVQPGEGRSRTTRAVNQERRT